MPHPLAVFEKIFVINLATRDDRRREMDEQFRRIGLSLESPRVELFTAIRPEERAEFPSIGARGCFMSHLGVLRLAAARGLGPILIVEDDLDFSSDFMRSMPAVAERLRRGAWSIFYGGYRLDDALPPGSGGACIELPASVGVQTAHFIAFDSSVVGTVVAYLEAQLERRAGDPRGGPMHVDGAYTWFRRDNPACRTLLAVSPLGEQRASRTDIHELGLRDTVPIVRSAMAALRRVRNRF